MITSCEVSLRWMPKTSLMIKSTSVPVMAWCHQATSHYLRQCRSKIMLPLRYKEFLSRVSCQKGPTRHVYAWQIGPFWQDTPDAFFDAGRKCENSQLTAISLYTLMARWVSPRSTWLSPVKENNNKIRFRLKKLKSDHCQSKYISA